LKKPFFILLIFLLFISLFCLGFTPTVNADITDTRTFTASTSDGHANVTNLNYDTAHDDAGTEAQVFTSQSIFNVGQTYDGSFYYDLWRSFVFFDTSAIPDLATIDTAILGLYVETDSSTTNFNVTIQDGTPTYPHDPVTKADYYYIRYSGNGGNRSTSTISGAGYWNITLSTDGEGWISKTGQTKFALRSSEDIADSAPSNDEYVAFYAREQGTSYAPRLYVTYTVDTDDVFSYTVLGPYVDTPTDTVFNGVCNVTVYPSYNETFSFLLDGSGGEDSEIFVYEQQPVFMAWNISDSVNYTRRIYFTDEVTEEFYIFVPSPDLPFYLYTFTITDFYGMTNAFLETRLYLSAQNEVVERQLLDSVNPFPYYLQWAIKYNLRVVCDEGSLDVGSFTPLTETSQNIVIARDAFPISYYGFNATVNAGRMNATYIQMNYTDNAELTEWIYTEITHLDGQTYTTDYTDNATASTVQINWYSALETIDYLVTVTALRDESLISFTFSCSTTQEEVNPFAPLDELGDNFPIQPRYIVGFGIVLACAGIFSYAHIVAGAFSIAITSAFLTAIGWLNLSWVLLALAFAISVLISIAWFKSREREI
jgi:hypothetical protein